MPFKSHAQQAYLRHHEPGVFKRWMKKYGPYKGKKKHSSMREAAKSITSRKHS